MKYFKDIVKLTALLGAFAILAYGIYIYATQQAPANKQRYQHPIYRSGGHW